VNQNGPLGRRDYALLLYMYNTGARVQEVADTRIAWLTLIAPYKVELLGKGRKWRTCPLWDSTAQYVRQLVAERGLKPGEDGPLFVNRYGQSLSRSGIVNLIERYTIKAAATTPGLQGQRVTPHTFRHTTAMHLLQSGVEVNVIRSWLGHASISTTSHYIEIDLAMKRKALATCEVTASDHRRPPGAPVPKSSHGSIRSETKRSPVISNDTFVSFLHCNRKAFLRAAGIPGQPADIETVLLDFGRVYRRQALKAFLAPYREQDVLHDPPRLEVALTNSPQVIVNATAWADGLSSLIQAAEQMKGMDQCETPVYAPVLFVLNESVSHADKMLLAFNALVLSSVQGVLPAIGKIVHGSNHNVLKCKIEPLVGEVRKLLAQIQAAQAEGATAPRVRLNRHCNVCEFRADCQKLAEETDDLSLLRGLSEKEIQKQQSRGVTTVTQFAYTYRPGRRGKRKTGKARRHDHALQAVALRDKKVYILDSPMVPHSRVALYLDVEGIPDRGFDYLIGLVVVVDDCTATHFFWADDRSQETAIWEACSKRINSFEDYTLYHYGQYEQRFLDRMRGLADVEGVATIDRIRARSCNVLAAIYSHIYFPTRYNGLKDVATFLGATWTAANASGIQSIAWRLAWETSRDETLKQQLIRYNLEDCSALRRVTEFVVSVCAGAGSGDGPAVASAADIQKETGFRFGKNKFFCPELEAINRCAYSDYQRDKVYLRTSSEMRKSLCRKQRVEKRIPKMNEEIECQRPKMCPHCKAQQIHIYDGKVNRKTVFDLKYTASGVKRWVVRYNSLRYKCWKCKRTFLSDTYRAVDFRFGSGLCSWAVYNHVALRQSYDDTNMSINEIFGYSFANGLDRIKPWLAERYRRTCESLKHKLRQGALIHADESKVVIKSRAGYVWTFTNMEEVVYVYTPTREGTILNHRAQSCSCCC
jgi:predicted RecB family nuclease